MITIEAFTASVDNQQTPPDELNAALKALWVEAKGNWDRAHSIAQSDSSADGSWVHAYLHRKEGDLANASYWYSRAGRTLPDVSLEEEWENIARALLAG
jgi:hypothetical protein